MKKRMNQQNSEHGGASTKFLIIIIALFLIANAGYNYIPVAYEAEDFKQEMETAVVQAMALPGNMDTIAITKLKLQRVASANNVPPNVFIEVKQNNGIYQARAAYSKEIKMLPFGLYDYVYVFDHTATPTGFLVKSKS
jgi:hypothetical protein